MVNLVDSGLFELRNSFDNSWKKRSDDKVQPHKLIKVSTQIENDAPAFGSVHNLWSMVKLSALSNFNKELSVDFVVVIDISASMRQNNKLAFVLATIQYFVTQLNENHKFCLILFNDKVTVATKGLLTMTQTNKDLILEQLLTIEAKGATNIGDALIAALHVIGQRNESDKSSISSIMLFSDGLSNTGLNSLEINDSLQYMPLIEGLTINTFGFGSDHDSDLLRKVAFSVNGGVYYYIENTESIPITFGEALCGVLSTVATNVRVQLCGQDGCRMTKVVSRFPLTENTSLKDYSLTVGTLSASESRSLVMKLSLRKMAEELSNHSLVKVIVTYNNLISNQQETIETFINVPRPEFAKPFSRPLELDMQLNRVITVNAIDNALVLARQTKDYLSAHEILQSAIKMVESSLSASEPYCCDLVSDLKQCVYGMTDFGFCVAQHYANAFSSMYLSEKSSGCRFLKGLNSSIKRSSGYGYSNSTLDEAVESASLKANEFLSRYTCMDTL